VVIVSSTSGNELAASYPSFLFSDAETKCGKEGGYGSYLETPKFPINKEKWGQ
jgi:hypothetical protein